MRKYYLILLIYLGTLPYNISAQNIESIKIGTEIPKPSFVLQDISGKEMSLDDVKKGNGLLVIFSCNTCPFVIGWEDRYNILDEHCKANDIGMILINSNEAQRPGVDDLDAMKEHARSQKYAMPYAIDENHQLADAFGATRTPETFLFDAGGKLVYKGVIDDNMEAASAVKNSYLMNAITNMVQGESIAQEFNRSIGCTIKRKK